MKKTLTKIQLSRILILTLPSILLLGAVSGSILSGLIPLSDRLDIDLGVTGEGGDTCCPSVEAAFIPNHVERREGTFEIYFTAYDDIDDEPEITAILQIFLPEGWQVTWDIQSEPTTDEEIKIEVDYEDAEIQVEGPDPEKILNDLSDPGGLIVENEQRLKIELRCDVVEIELLEPLIGSIELKNFEGEPISMITDLLKVTAIDDAGNIGIATATPSFVDTCPPPEDYIEYIETQIELLQGILIEYQEEFESSEAEEEIEAAISHLEKARSAFEYDLIRCAFNKIKCAVHNLMDAQDEGVETQDVIYNLVDLVQCIVDQAMSEAIDSVGEENSWVSKAKEKYCNALEKIDEGKYDKGINEFRKAYSFLMKVLHNCVATFSISTTDTSATITLTLHKVGYIVCYYGIDTPIYSTEVTPLSMDHEITLTDLIPNSQYYYYLEVTHDLDYPNDPDTPDDDGDTTHQYPYDSSYLTFTTQEEIMTKSEEQKTEEPTSEEKITTTSEEQTTKEPTSEDQFPEIPTDWTGSIPSDWSDGTPGFEIIPIIACLLIGVFLYRRRRSSKI